ncbi:MAG: metallophosphoesterase family protein [Deltaproteobacteria bacterium]|nr:metallophosphoesterase family protein [Deltaproteobacteria bacterium]
MRIGLLSDTHLSNRRPALWEEVSAVFRGVDLILHAGDIVAPGVLDWLERFAPVRAARGNNDMQWTDPRMADVQWLDIEGWRLAMLHDIEPEDRPIDVIIERELGGQRPDILITGHTHLERIDHRDGVVQINSGSPVQPHLFSNRLGSVGILELEPALLRARILNLGESEDLRNPARKLELELPRSSLSGGVRSARTDGHSRGRPRERGRRGRTGGID